MFNKFKRVIKSIVSPPKLADNQFMRFILTSVSFFFIASTYSICRRLKDIIIGRHLDFSYITFVKTFIILPGIAILLILYTWMRKRVSLYSCMYFMLFPFIVLFGFYGAVEYLDPTWFARWSPNIDLSNYVSDGNLFKAWLFQLSHIINNIWYVMFYFCSEAFGSFGIFAFWAYANSLTEPSTASTIYPYYTMFASLSNIFSGVYGVALGSFLSKRFVDSEYHQVFNYVNMFSCVILIVLTLLCYHFSYLENDKFYSIYKEKYGISSKSKKKKEKVGFFESLKGIFSNKRVLYLSLSIIGYMACINIAEISWKQLTKSYFVSTGNKAGMNAIFSMVQIFVGILTVVCGYIGHYVLNNRGWTAAAMVSPVAVGFTAALFLITKIVYINVQSGFLLIFAILIGFIQNVASKACKYSFFDSTKELVFVYMDDENERIKAKSIAEVAPSRGGKALGSWVQMGLTYARVPIDRMDICLDIIARDLFLFVCLISAVWTMCTLRLGKIMEKKIQEHKDREFSIENNTNDQSSSSDKESDECDAENNSNDKQ